MIKNRISRVIILGIFSLIGIIIFQVFWIYNTFSNSEKQFNQNIKIALFNVANKMAIFNKDQLPDISPVKQISSNNFVVDINDEIDPYILEQYLEEEFKSRHINIDYEYAIYHCENDAMVLAKYINNPDIKNERIENTEFPKFADFDYYFAIRFPSKTSSIIYDMNVWFISAFVLITAIFFFIYAIYIILRQKKLSEVQKDFINNMTHELKTPISTIAISAQVISDPLISTQPERLHKYATIISNQSKRLESQVEKVLQSTLSKKGNIHLKVEPLNVNESLANIIKDFDLKTREKNGEIILNTDAEIGLIMADKNHFENLVFNLLDNAIKYCTNNPKIIVSTIVKAKKVHISVEDNGIGIDEKYRKKVFYKFFRVPTGNIHNVKGFGLGLDYVKNVAKAHKWKILLDCEQEKGCKFIIIIPI
jgi:two-component system phosphate regulon sensor histidine kinase PhoR